jgi:hypothetical protein
MKAAKIVSSGVCNINHMQRQKEKYIKWNKGCVVAEQKL